MSKRTVKVIKRIELDLHAAEPVPAGTSPADHSARKTAGVVDQWIAERRAARIEERLFADETISAWAEPSADIQESS